MSFFPHLVVFSVWLCVSLMWCTDSAVALTLSLRCSSSTNWIERTPTVVFSLLYGLSRVLVFDAYSLHMYIYTLQSIVDKSAQIPCCTDFKWKITKSLYICVRARFKRIWRCVSACEESCESREKTLYVYSAMSKKKNKLFC